MCMGGSSPKTPKAEAAPTPPPVIAPLEADNTSTTAGDEERKRRRAASGRSDTILTGGLGDASAVQAGGKKLLGE